MFHLSNHFVVRPASPPHRVCLSGHLLGLGMRLPGLQSSGPPGRKAVLPSEVFQAWDSLTSETMSGPAGLPFGEPCPAHCCMCHSFTCGVCGVCADCSASSSLPEPREDEGLSVFLVPPSLRAVPADGRHQQLCTEPVEPRVSGGRRLTGSIRG